MKGHLGKKRVGSAAGMGSEERAARPETITVEFFGIPRQRAGLSATTISSGRLAEVLADLADRFPRLGESCLESGRLKPGYIANLNGQRFVTDPDTRLEPGDSLLILSADAGG